MTCREVADIAEHLSYGMELHNLAPVVNAEDKEWRFIAIQSKNRKEWNLTNLANMHQNITTVSLYDTLGVDATKFIVNQTELTTMIVSNDYISKIIKMKAEDDAAEAPKLFRLKNIVGFEDTVTEEQKEAAKKVGIELFTIFQLVEDGRQMVRDGKATQREPTPDDCFMFSYTSGTTGDPKGVKLTHKMMVQCAWAMKFRL
jgi:long-chain acyl-CoA synthetase